MFSSVTESSWSCGPPISVDTVMVEVTDVFLSVCCDAELGWLWPADGCGSRANADLSTLLALLNILGKFSWKNVFSSTQYLSWIPLSNSIQQIWIQKGVETAAVRGGWIKQHNGSNKEIVNWECGPSKVDSIRHQNLTGLLGCHNQHKITDEELMYS